MGTLADREFNLEGWGPDKRLIEGPCGHCHYAVSFKEPEQHACLEFRQIIQLEEETEEIIDHYFIMGICPRPRCQQATIIYRQERVILYEGRPQSNPELLDERVIFPVTSHRLDLPEEVPESLRELYQEAASIEHLSPNGSAFLARRILEQALRERYKKQKGKLVHLIDEFLKEESAPLALHQMMHDIREFGNIAGHPAQTNEKEWTKIDPAEASYTLDVVAEILDHFYVKPAKIDAMRERWELKKRGETPKLHSKNEIVVGGSEIKESSPPEDEIPF